MLALQKKIAYLILGMKGGENRIQIINALNERPYNINQLSQVLDLNYRTIKHHMSILHKNEIVSTSKAGGYGDVYFLSPKMEGNFEVFLEIEKKYENSKKLNEFAESRKYYKDIVEQSNDAIILADIDGRVYFWNKGAEKLFGFKKGEVLGIINPVIPKNKKSEFEKVCKKVLNGKIVPDYETKWITKSKKLIDVGSSLSPIRDQEDNFIGISIISRDISERIKHHLEIEKEREKLDDIVSALGAGLNLIDLDRKIIWANKTFVSLFGSLDKIMGKHCYDIYWGNDNPCENCLCGDVEKSGEMKQEIQIRETKDGEKKKFLIASTPIKDDNGQVVQVLELVLDIEKGF